MQFFHTNRCNVFFHDSEKYYAVDSFCKLSEDLQKESNLCHDNHTGFNESCIGTDVFDNTFYTCNCRTGHVSIPVLDLPYLQSASQNYSFIVSIKEMRRNIIFSAQAAASIDLIYKNVATSIILSTCLPNPADFECIANKCSTNDGNFIFLVKSGENVIVNYYLPMKNLSVLNCHKNKLASIAVTMSPMTYNLCFSSFEDKHLLYRIWPISEMGATSESKFLLWLSLFMAAISAITFFFMILYNFFRKKRNSTSGSAQQINYRVLFE